MGKFVDGNKNNKSKKDIETYEHKKNFTKENGKIVFTESTDSEMTINNVTKESNSTNLENIKIDSEVQDERYDLTSVVNNITTMGTTTNTDYISLVNSAMSDYNQAINDYSNYLEGSPTFVTYFKINKGQTSKDVGLNGVTEIVGAESPVKYDKIINFPIWNIEEIVPDLEWDEFIGLNTNAEITGIVIPNTIKPKADDVIVINYKGKDVVFNVINVSVNNILSQSFYRIQLNLKTHDINFLNSQTVRTFAFDFTNNCLVNQSLSKISDMFRSIIVKLMNQYKIQFYKEKYNSFIFDNMYDKYLHKFIEETHLFIMSKTFMFNIHVEPTVLFTVSDNTKYDNSIYERIQSLRKKEFITKVVPIPMQDRSLYNVFTLYRPVVQELDHNSQIGFIPFMSDYTLDTQYSDQLLTASERLIRQYMTNNGDTSYVNYLPLIEDLVVEYYLKDYIQYPLVIYILKKIVSKINEEQSQSVSSLLNDIVNNNL